jgi:hypothetical protein
LVVTLTVLRGAPAAVEQEATVSEADFEEAERLAEAA